MPFHTRVSSTSSACMTSTLTESLGVPSQYVSGDLVLVRRHTSPGVRLSCNGSSGCV